MSSPGGPDLTGSEQLATAAQAAEQNRLLRVLPLEEYAWLQRRLELVMLETKQVLAEPNEPIQFVYFPETSVVSMVNRMADGGGVEVGTIGNEGMVGLTVFLGVDALPSATLTQIRGEAKRIPAEVFADGTQEHHALKRLLQRYTHAFLTQVAQTASCNRVHSIEERCARWLLMVHDRVERVEFKLTHEFLSFMLGVRRAGVTVAAGMLQEAGLIRYSRGHITILDRAGLEAVSCECYGIVRAEFERLLP